jgi:uncharacterized protein YdaU (DUF1376 family)
MSNGDRWMPLYVADYLGDTMHLTTLQHGAYVLLLMHYWKTGPLPADQEALAAISKVEKRTWPSVWAKLSGFFTENADGTLHQKRMDRERKRWADISDKRSDAGKRGAEAKHRPHPNGGGAPITPPPSQPETVQRHVIQQPGDGKTVANAMRLPVDNLANARILPDVCQPISGNCHDFATPPVPSTEKKVSNYNNLPSTSPVLARVAAACETPQAGTYGSEPQQEPVSNALKFAAENIAGKLARKLESSGKNPAGRRPKLTVAEQQNHVIYGEILPPSAGLHPVDPIRTVAQQLAALGFPQHADA